MGEEKNIEVVREEKVAREVAEQDFDRWAAAWRIDTDTEHMDGEDAQDFKNEKHKIVTNIVKGYAVLNEQGNFVLKLFAPVGVLEELELKRPRGFAWTASDKPKLNKNATKTIHMIANAVGQVPAIINRMDGIDVKFLFSVYNLFFGA